jgi:hypothetical protein
MMRSSAYTRSARLFAIAPIVDKFQIDIVVLRLSADTKTPGLNARKDDANKLSERGRVEGDNAVGAAAFCVLGVDAVARNRCLCDATN